MTHGRPGGREYWRSLDDLADKPEFRELVRREFPLFADEMLAPSRRDFLKLMGASLAMAGTLGCRRWPVERVVPFASQPEGTIPGVTTAYATAMDVAGSVQGLLVTSCDGRPIKIEGNPAHPANLGGTDAFAQAAVLQIYDPDRATSVSERDGGSSFPRTWDDFKRAAAAIVREHRASGGRGLHVLSGSGASPSLLEMKRRFAISFPEGRWHEWEPLSRDNEREGARLAFGRPLRAQVALDRAEVVVALDADTLVSHPNGLRHARDWAAWRSAPGGRMNRLYAVESGHSFTGGVADHRLCVQAGMVAVVAGKLAAALLDRGLPLPSGFEALRPAVAAFERNGFSHPAIATMADDLARSRGRSAVLAGPKHPPVLHALVHVLNAMLENAGATVTYTAELDEDRVEHAASIRALAGEMAAGRVRTLFVLGGNPAFDAPADLDFRVGLAKVRNSFRLGDYADETSQLCRWHLPRAHFLEAWGDVRSWDGTYTVVQPLIEPLYDGKSDLEILAMILEDSVAAGYDIVRRTAATLVDPSADFETKWRRLLHDGLLEASAFPAVSPALVAPSWAGDLVMLADARPLEGASFQAVFDRSNAVHDGRFANLAWLAELPDPFTKVTWDNPALVSPATAKALGVATGDVVRITIEGRHADVPVFVAPGQAPHSITLHPGWGRTAGGRVADGTGFDLFALRGSASLWTATATVVPTGERYPIATTQDHHVADALGRHEGEVRAGTLVREGSLALYREHPEFARHLVHVPEDVHLWKPHAYDGHKWGMTIDLSACVGCATCTIACQAENNIPVVGKVEVARGREMHWIRVDRYYKGSPDAPALAFQPMTCHHCENAPCEQVCPVAATVHDGEGLNVMIYNRCVGTRYCSNNCPYKVRRFNWFNNHQDLSDVEKMVFNPDVTVRSRGVMEKCTFCIQRIEGAKILAKNERRALADGEIVTACQQACPTGAIVFGDLNGKSADGGPSTVAARAADSRAYGVLAEINTKPRLTYLARLRHPHEGLEEPAPAGDGGSHPGSH